MSGQIMVVELTGGPGSGKTSAVEAMAAALMPDTRRVIALPEMATLWHEAGIDYGAMVAGSNPQRRIGVQSVWHRVWFSVLDAAVHQAKLMPEYDWVILADRGPIECQAYLPPDEFQQFLRQNGWREEDLRHQSDAVLHFRSAAFNGSYTTGNNPARREDAAGARDLDQLLLDCRVGHPKLRIIPATRIFADKEAAAVRALSALMSGTEVERRFLLRRPPDFSLPPLTKSRCADIRQTYLYDSSSGQSRIRRLTSGNRTWYTWTRKQGSGLVRAEEEVTITLEQYQRLMACRDNGRQAVVKRRHYFVDANRYYELDEVMEPAARACWLLELELDDPADNLSLPPFLEVDREVTDTPHYSNSAIACG